MKIGLSISVAILKQKNKLSEPWLNAINSTYASLAQLRELHIKNIELRVERTDYLNLNPALDKIQALGFCLTFHKSIKPPEHFRLLEAEYHNFLTACRSSGIENPLVVVHGATGSSGHIIKIRKNTITVLKRLGKRFPEIKFSLEVCRWRKSQRNACDSYSATSKILQHCKLQNLGICWDLGHSYFNSLQTAEKFIPDDKFLQQVNNVHVHDLINLKTHFPLQPSSLPISAAVRSLHQAGYKNALTIEIYPQRVNCGPAYYGKLKETVLTLQECLTSLS